MNDKVSKYNIEVEHTKCMLLYNALTDVLLPISFKDYAAIETLLEHLPEFSNKFPDLYASFKRSGFIINANFDELAYIKLQNKKRVYAHSNYHITINPTLDCNLKCWYCSVGYAGAEHNRERMSNETVAALNKHIENLIVKQKAHSISLDWFGGEPLMYYDEVISRISRIAHPLASQHNTHFQQQITTNATLLNEERVKQMRDFNFTFFQIPIDGNERKHNLVKRFSDKQGSYRKVIENINLIADIIPNVSINVRINYDKQTLKHIQDIAADFSEKSKSCISIDFQRVWQIPLTDKTHGLLQTAKEYFREAGFRSSFWAYRPRTFRCCYADSFHHYVINYNGKVFKCTARDYGDDMVLGNLQPSGAIAWNDGLVSLFYEKAGFENETCENCNMLPLCMGACIQRSYEIRIKGQPFQCVYENVEYSLSNHIIDVAKRRNLIQ